MLSGSYRKYYRQWESHREGAPPVFIVVCNNTNVSTLVYDYIAGWQKPLPGGGSVVVPGYQVPNFREYDFRSITEAEGGVLITPQEVMAAKALDRAAYCGRGASRLMS